MLIIFCKGILLLTDKDRLLNRIFYLGPEGSYSDAVKTKFSDFYADDCKFLPYSSIIGIMKALESEDAQNTGAVIPIENSIEGVVRETVDNLFNLAGAGIKITAETTLPVKHSLIGFAKDKCDIKIISSHPQALAQCRNFIFSTWGENIIQEAVLSTSAAVSSLTEDNPQRAAIGSGFCAEKYNIPVMQTDINDEKNNTTRFILLSSVECLSTSNNKTSITFSTENKPGALNKVLTILEEFGLNMSYIDSRPSKKKLGEYVFYIDFEGHKDDNNVALCLIKIQQYVKEFELLGSYVVLK